MTVRILAAKTLSNDTSTNPAIALTGANQPVAGRKLYVATWSWNGIGLTTVNVTDSKSNTYARRDNSTASGNTRAMLWGCDYSGTGDCTVTVDIASSSGIYMGISIFEVDDLIGSENDTGARGASQGSTSGVDGSATGAGNTAQANNLLVSVIGVNTSDATANVAVPATWTSITTESDGSANECGGVAYKYISSIQTPSAAWSYDDTSAEWQAIVVALKQTTTGSAKGGMLMGVG